MSLENQFDVKLDESKGYYDILIDDDGDILTDDQFNTATLMTLHCHKRALPSEMPDASRRRGWIGNESTPGFEIGSKLWLYYQERITASILEQLSSQLNVDILWFVNEGLLKSISVRPIFDPKEVGVEITFNRHQSESETRYYKLWDRTN